MATYIARNGLFYDPDLVKQTLSALNDQRNISQFCDVILRVSGTQIYAHSNVLAAASPYFGSFLGVGTDCPRMFSQKQPQIIEIHIDSKEGDGGYGEAVCKVVEFMYTSKINLTTDLVCQIIQIGKIMQMDKLLHFCEYFQNGENDNKPRDIATCTTGLQEIADLLGSRSKTVKRGDASTMTEASLFLKLAGHTNDQSTLCLSDFAINKSTCSEIQLPVAPNPNELTLSKSDMNVKDHKNHDKYFSDVKTIGFDSLTIDQNDASLLLEISNVRLPAEQLNKAADNINENISSTRNEMPIVIDSSLLPIENRQNTVERLAEMISVTLEKFVEDSKSVSFHEMSKTSLPSEMPSVLEQKEQKDINLEDLSDLVIFNPPVSTTMLQSSKVWRRGRGRGRGRARGRGRGRRPGRPRKVKVEPEESDPEFEEFIDRLERGDPVMPSEAETVTNTDRKGDGEDTKEMVYMEQDDVSIEEKQSNSKNQTGGNSWKSRRSRKKPSQLRKDYIMHSLTKRSRRQPEVSKFGSSTVKAQQNEIKIEESSNINFICQKCEYTTTLFKLYRQHLKTHPETDPRYFVCEKCNFNTTKSREFTAHKQKHMVEELICSFCEHQSETGPEFLEHVKKHEGDCPYFCSECDSRFKTKNQLIAHKPKHQLEKPFVCAICKSGFKWKHALKNHMITHSATKDHLCDECGYATAHKSQLKSHKLIHTGLMFKCPVLDCNFEATKRQNLKYHMVTHTHEKPHQCEVCGQSFSLIKNMRRHMLLHTDTRPFSCKICSFSTTRYDKLKEHNHKMHNIGEAPVSKTEIADEAVSLLNSSVTYVSTDGITFNSDGGITEETLQTIAQLASAQNLSGIELQGSTINIEQTAEDGTVYPIIATVQSYTDSSGDIQYIAEIPE